MRKVTSRIGLLVCLAVAATDYARSSGLQLLRPVRQESPESIGVELDPAVYESMATRQHVVVRNFPLPGMGPVDLDLTRFSVLASDARFVVVDGTGEREVPAPAISSFRGTVIDDSESVVVLNLFEGRIAGWLRSGDAEYVITPRTFHDEESAATDITIRTRGADPDQPDRPFCDTELPEVPRTARAPAAASQIQGSPIDGSTLLEAAIAIDTTYEWYAHFGSAPAAQNYILNLMSQVSTIYETEVNIQLEVSYLRIFTTPSDPYTDGTTNPDTLLDELSLEWNTNQTAIDRTVAHLFSVRPTGGAGVAYLDVLCNHSHFPGNSFDYGVSTMSAANGSWEKSLVAHELGHNFASPHTHCYVPEIDQCAVTPGCYEGPINFTVGTIMSYCPTAVVAFHQRVEDEAIRPAAETAYPTCMTTDDPPPPPPLPPQSVTPF